jgi:hypothetical protein
LNIGEGARGDKLAEARDEVGRLRRGPGRRPDGVLVRANTIEVELTPKRDRREYHRKLAWYASQLRYGLVQWFVPSFTLRERLMGVAHELSLEDLLRVAPLPPERDYSHGIKADRRPDREPFTPVACAQLNATTLSD